MSALADLVLILHSSFAGFVVFGLVLIVAGGVAGWSWISNGWFRIAHLLSIVVVVAQAWLGILCPLTSLEMWLRRHSGEETYQGSFIEHWLQRILFYDLPDWIFVVAYSLCGLLIVLAWIMFPPRFSTPRRQND